MTSYVMKGHGISTENIFNYFLFWLMVRFENLSAGRRQLFVSNNFSHFPTGLTFFKAIIKQWFNIRLQFNFFKNILPFVDVPFESPLLLLITLLLSKRKTALNLLCDFYLLPVEFSLPVLLIKHFGVCIFFWFFFLTLSFFIASDRPFSNFQFVHNKGCHQRNYLF